MSSVGCCLDFIELHQTLVCQFVIGVLERVHCLRCHMLRRELDCVTPSSVSKYYYVLLYVCIIGVLTFEYLVSPYERDLGKPFDLKLCVQT